MKLYALIFSFIIQRVYCTLCPFILEPETRQCCNKLMNDCITKKLKERDIFIFSPIQPKPEQKIIVVEIGNSHIKLTRLVTSPEPIATTEKFALDGPMKPDNIAKKISELLKTQICSKYVIYIVSGDRFGESEDNAKELYGEKTNEISKKLAVHFGDQCYIIIVLPYEFKNALSQNEEKKSAMLKYKGFEYIIPIDAFDLEKAQEFSDSFTSLKIQKSKSFAVKHLKTEMNAEYGKLIDDLYNLQLAERLRDILSTKRLINDDLNGKEILLLKLAVNCISNFAENNPELCENLELSINDLNIGDFKQIMNLFSACDFVGFDSCPDISTFKITEDDRRSFLNALLYTLKNMKNESELCHHWFINNRHFIIKIYTLMTSNFAKTIKKILDEQTNQKHQVFDAEDDKLTNTIYFLKGYLSWIQSFSNWLNNENEENIFFDSRQTFKTLKKKYLDKPRLQSKLQTIEYCSIVGDFLSGKLKRNSDLVN